MSTGLKSNSQVSESPKTNLWYRSRLFAQKELRETLRDRRTIITLLAMPLLLYPLLGMVFRFLAVSQLKKTAGTEYVVAVGTEVEALWLKTAIDFGDRVLEARAARAAAELRALAPADSTATVSNNEKNGEKPSTEGDVSISTGNRSGLQSGTVASDNTKNPEKSSDSSESTPTDSESLFSAKPRMRILTANDPATLNLNLSVATLEADLGAKVELQSWDGSVEVMQPALVRLTSNRDSMTSRDAQRYVEDRLQAASTSIVLRQARQYNPGIRMPVRITLDSVASNQKSRGFLGLLPLVLLLMTVTGGVYPAIDLTAGERERDTLETLIALPVSRVHLLLAKYVAVFTVTLLTGLVNILAMTATVYALQMETQLFGENGISIYLGLSLLSILIVFGLFYSAVLLALTSASRSFKEAQAYLIPLMLMSIAPGLVILLPGWHLEGLISGIPLVNMLLLARDVFEGSVQILPAMVAVVSTLFYAACALTLAARIFGTDAIAVGSRGTWSDLWKRPSMESTAAPLSTALFTLALMFPLYFFASGVLNRTAGTAPAIRLMTGGGLTILLFGLFPLAIARFRRLNLSGTWQLYPPLSRIWPAAIIIGLGTWPWVYELVLMTQQLGIAQIDEDRLKQVADVLERWKAIPLALMVVCLGVIPGVFEELFFRGFLLSSFRAVFRPWPSIILCGLIFGVFHVIAAEGAAFERLLPSATLGCLLAWIAVRSNSVFPGMLAHVLHNSSLLVIAHYRDELSSMAIGASQQEHLPGLWLLISAAALLTGVIWITFTTRQKPMTSHHLGDI